MEYIIKCRKCGKEFKINCSEKQYLNDKYNHYCSFSCRNSHIVTEETKKKISNAFRGKTKDVQYTTCKCCGKEFVKNGKEKYCSNECKILYKRLPTFIKYFGLNKEYVGTEKIFIEFNRIK